MVTIVKDSDHIKEILGQYKDCNTQLWAYSVSLRRIAIRLWKNIHEEQVFLLAGSVFYIQGHIDRKDANITIAKSVNEYNEAAYSIIDETDGFRILANSGILLARGDFSDFGMQFDDHGLFDWDKAIEE